MSDLPRKYNVVIVCLCRPLHARAAVDRVRDVSPSAHITLVDYGGGLDDLGADEVVGPDWLSRPGRPDVLFLAVTNRSEWLGPVRLFRTLAACLMMRPHNLRVILFGWSGPKSFTDAWRDIAGRAACIALRPFYLATLRIVHIITAPLPAGRKSSGKVLALSLDLIGDLVWAAPAISSLKSIEGVREVHLLVSRRTADLARCIPGVDKVITYESPWLKKIHYPDGGGPGIAERFGNLLTRIGLYTERYGAALDFRGEPGHAPLMYLTGAPARVSRCDRQATCIRPDDLMYMLTHGAVPGGGMHTLERNLGISRTLGANASAPAGAWLSPGDKAGSRMKTLTGVGPGSLVLMQPGASRAEKRWSLDGFADVGNRLIKERGARVVIAGGPEETELCGELAGRVAGSVNLCGRTTLREFAALVGICDLVVCNDTSAVSISSAMGTPVVCMVAVDTGLLGPYGVPHRVLQKKPPCYDPLPEHCMCPYTYRCLGDITPEEVYLAACELLDGD